MYTGCKKCGYSCHILHAAGDFCPRCGRKLVLVYDTRELGVSDKEQEDYNKYLELKKKYE